MLVISALALIAFLAAAILTFIRSEDRASRMVADFSALRTLQTLPEKLVISQIRTATSNLGGDHTWTSQPGMIRVFGSSTSGTPAQADEYYKLYSSDSMTLPQGADPLAESAQVLKWKNSPSIWTDLNEPVVANQRREQGAWTSIRRMHLVYPIFDPPPSGQAASLADGFDLPTAGTPQPPEAMPVKWIYVLADGTLVAGNNLRKARRENPIVGRIAFWTDDESCKLNLNTASEPGPWSRPVTTSPMDLGYARSIPARGEHYREAAHPAFTSLAPVLRHFGQSGSGRAQPLTREPQSLFGTGSSPWWAEVKKIHDRLPSTPQRSASSSAGTDGGAQAANDVVLPKEERWFSTVDEYFFAAAVNNTNKRQRNATLTSGTAPASGDVTQDDIANARFFLTTHSKAPETNPFGWPKISLWPVSDVTSERHQLDRKMVLAASLPGSAGAARQDYFLQRAGTWSVGNAGPSQSAILDTNLSRNVQLFDYLSAMADKPIPGAGGSFLQKYGAASKNQLITAMFDMVRWGVNPASPQNQPPTSPLTPEYRHLPPSLGNPGATSGNGMGSAVPLQVPVANGEGEAVGPPGSKVWVTKGYGRFPMITEVALVLIAREVGNTADVTGGDPSWAKKTTKVQAFIVVKPFCVAPGGMPQAARYTLSMDGLQNWTYDGQNLFPGGAGTMRISCPVQSVGMSGDRSGYAGLVSQFLQPDGTPKEVNLGAATPDEDKDFVFVGPEILLGPRTSGDASTSIGDNRPFVGAPLTVSCYDFDSNPTDPGALVQQVIVNLPPPPVDLPVPLMLMQDALAFSGKSDKQVFPDDRFKPSGSPVRIPFLKRGDVVRSMEMRVRTNSGGEGDLRLFAALAELPPKDAAGNPLMPNGLLLPPFDLVPPPSGTSTAEDFGFQAHHLRDGAYMVENQTGNNPAGDPLATSDTAGNLVARYAITPPPINANATPLTYGLLAVPATPFDGAAINADDRPGDFDNGPGIIEDGPYINMPDQSNGLTETASLGAGSTVGGAFRRGGDFIDEDGVTYSPWRQMGSAVGFGSLPTSVFGIGVAGSSPTASDFIPRPWQTLLFCPNPPSRTTAATGVPAYAPTGASGGTRDHFGFKDPPDRWWLDFFWMPPVEPQGVCDDMATEGKVNLNYQIIPFTWIKRATAMHGVLAGVRMKSIPSNYVLDAAGASHYKAYSTTGVGTGIEFNYAINADATLKQFDNKFTAGEVFVSPSEICDTWLVPERLPSRNYGTAATPPAIHDTLLNWWEGPSNPNPTDGMEATGDNTREAPYGQIYPRVCTRSNVFKVHYRVQALQKARSTSPGTWDESKDRVAGEYRGEAVIERYIDPKRSGIPDFAGASGTQTLDDYYDYRVLGRKQFAP